MPIDVFSKCLVEAEQLLCTLEAKGSDYRQVSRDEIFRLFDSLNELRNTGLRQELVMRQDELGLREQISDFFTKDSLDISEIITDARQAVESVDTDKLFALQLKNYQEVREEFQDMLNLLSVDDVPNSEINAVCGKMEAQISRFDGEFCTALGLPHETDGDVTDCFKMIEPERVLMRCQEIITALNNVISEMEPAYTGTDSQG